MGTATPHSITLPHSKVQIHFTSDYDQTKMADFARSLAIDELLAKRVRDNPIAELAKIGVIISDEDRKRITDEDVLFAMGHRAAVAPGTSEGLAAPAIALPLIAAAVVVVVAVVNFPGPAY